MNARGRCRFAIVALCVFYTLTTRADDAASLPGVLWDAPPECSENTFRERLRPTDPPTVLRVHIENVGTSGAAVYRGTLQLDAAKRSVESSRCDEVVRALALAGNTFSIANPRSTTPPPQRPPPPPPPHRSPYPRPRHRHRCLRAALFFGGAGAAFDGSRAMPLFTLGAMSTFGRNVALGLGAEFTGRFTSAEVAPYTASIFWLTTRYQVCALFGNTPFRFDRARPRILGSSTEKSPARSMQRRKRASRPHLVRVCEPSGFRRRTDRSSSGFRRVRSFR